MPTPTDLVTDLPADFEVFGQAVDSSMADLKGGTTGQILSKATNADMDFVWTSANPGDITGVTATSPLTGGGTSGDVTVGIQASSTTQSGAVQLEDSTSSTSTTKAATPNSVKSAYDLANAAIAKSTLTTAGDTLYRNATVPARLGIGTAGQVLTVNSGATAPEWATPSGGSTYVSGKNFIINGGMDIWQRGTSGFGTSTGTYTADRWVLGSSSTTVTQDADVPTSPYFNYSLKMVGTGDNSLIQRMESANSTLLAGQTITFSFYAKRTSGTGALDVRFYYPSAKDNFTTITQIGSTSVVSASPSSSWTRYSVTAAIGTNVTTGLQIFINNTGASTTFITGAQLEMASSASNFSRNASTIALELAACQRYFQTIQGNATSSTAGVSFAYASSTTNGVAYFYPRSSFRVVPSVSQSSLFLSDIIANNYTVTSLSINSGSSTVDMIRLDAGVASGLTAKNWYSLQGNATTSYVQLSAEL